MPTRICAAPSPWRSITKSALNWAMPAAAPSPPIITSAPFTPPMRISGRRNTTHGAALDGMKAAGSRTFVHDLITVDDEWQRNTGDAVAAQLARCRPQGPAHHPARRDLLAELERLPLLLHAMEPPAAGCAGPRCWPIARARSGTKPGSRTRIRRAARRGHVTGHAATRRSVIRQARAHPARRGA